MKITSTELSEVKIIEYDKHVGNRGFSYPILNKEQLEQAGIDFKYVEEYVYL
ncbi:hypothetical protein [Inconstantimicrobium porci]|uniref:hypothetical protein n=1 Tax=Inconstantimicrobium porci TaxID=2652291 RepID=UPI00240A2A1E|nr:hypothetical protein [Inconstantimicrobium porci]MDD6771668.1 hypothetical protein [Inconstantimicrobium porci]